MCLIDILQTYQYKNIMYRKRKKEGKEKKEKEKSGGVKVYF